MTRRKRPTTTKKKGPYSTWRTSATVGTEMVRVHTRREDGRVLYTEVYLMNASGQKFRHSKYRPGFIDKVSDDTAAAVAQLRVYLRGGGVRAPNQRLSLWKGLSREELATLPKVQCPDGGAE
jgi:hypothetical protein